MKKLFLSLMLAGFSALAQDPPIVWPTATNWSVTFGPGSSCYPTSAPSWSVFLGTNTSPVVPPAILMTEFAFLNAVATNQPLISQMQSNCAFIAKSNILANYNLWYSQYTNMPLGIADSSNRIVSIGSRMASFNSGTNTAAGTNNIHKLMYQDLQVTYSYLNNIIAYLSRLGPGLQEIYKPLSDPVGH